jgi:hypothetical protein
MPGADIEDLRVFQQGAAVRREQGSIVHQLSFSESDGVGRHSVGDSTYIQVVSARSALWLKATLQLPAFSALRPRLAGASGTCVLLGVDATAFVRAILRVVLSLGAVLWLCSSSHGRSPFDAHA